MTTVPESIRSATPAGHQGQKSGSPPLYLIGTPDGCWVHGVASWLQAGAAIRRELSPAAMDRVARQIDSGAADRGRVLFEASDITDWLPAASGQKAAVALCPQGCWVAAALADRVAGAGFVAWVEHPATGLAAALAQGRVLNPEVWLAHWRAGARQLLRLAQLQRRRLLLLDADEARLQPAAVQAALQDRFAVHLPAATEALAGEVQPNPAPLALALADWMAAGRQDLLLLHRELLASCDLLQGQEPPAEVERRSTVLAAAPVVRDYYALRNSQQDLQQARQQQAEATQQAESQVRAAEQLQARLDAQTAGLAASQLEVERLVRALDEARTVCADSALQAGTAAQQLEQAQTEGAQWRQQAQALQVRLEHEARAAEDQARARDEALSAARDEAAQRAAQLAHLQSALQHLQRDDAQRQAQAQAQLQGLQQALDHAELERQSLKEGLMRLQTLQAELVREAGVQVQQLHEVQEALEQSERRVHKESQRHAAARKDAERHRLALEEAQAQRQASETHRGAVQAQLDAAREDLASVRKDSADLRLALAQLQKEVASLKQGTSSLERQKQALLADAASLEKEAAALRKESAHQAREAGARARDAAQAQAALQLSRQEVEQTKASLRFLKDPHEPPIGEARLLTARLEPPYRELTVALRAVQSAARQVAEATVRLVEHHGHPGLAVFAPTGVQPLLASWQESGREANRAYMLLVPTDEKSRPLLDALGSDDWTLLLTVVRRIERELRAAAPSTQAHWLGLAQRLLGQLHAMPPRLRHAGAERLPSDAGLALRLLRVQWAAHRVDRLDVRWQPAPGGGQWAVMRGPAAPPLQSWPDRADGASPDELVVPLDPSSAASEQAGWAQLPAADRLFLAAVLEAWPALVAGLDPAAQQAAGGAAAAEAAALALRESARAHLGPDGAVRQAMPSSSLLRRAARRLRGRAAAG